MHLQVQLCLFLDFVHMFVTVHMLQPTYVSHPPQTSIALTYVAQYTTVDYNPHVWRVHTRPKIMCRSSMVNQHRGPSSPITLWSEKSRAAAQKECFQSAYAQCEPSAAYMLRLTAVRCWSELPGGGVSPAGTSQEVGPEAVRRAPARRRRLTKTTFSWENLHLRFLPYHLVLDASIVQTGEPLAQSAGTSTLLFRAAIDATYSFRGYCVERLFDLQAVISAAKREGVPEEETVGIRRTASFMPSQVKRYSFRFTQQQ
ncbi:hypothetical protein NUW54_g759 [Trametes sanguinea]|uniref:Uncharacterized protein n=1 Tax=Trametes sanguinea TaxID=158606 RepID=A0ACC1QB76_9APHY|nr:hypothetical protein NUW54_g759 [Trametes sanguinea]